MANILKRTKSERIQEEEEDTEVERAEMVRAFPVQCAQGPTGKGSMAEGMRGDAVISRKCQRQDNELLKS